MVDDILEVGRQNNLISQKKSGEEREQQHTLQKEPTKKRQILSILDVNRLVLDSRNMFIRT